ncbi:seven transmembrane domain protein [Aphelenchoides avenae]|nr:seven transmembrane domain protein [Aphelenchus avenae]
MSFFHFANCVILAYAPYLIAYKYSGLSEYGSIWKCAQAALIYFITQFIKMLTFATFFPASDVDGFDPVSELVKSGADILDVLGLHIAISYWLSGKGEVRFLAAGLGWAAAHSLASYLVGFVVGARTSAFHWKYIQAALESNVDLVFYFCMAALVWLFNRSDLSAAIKRLVGLLLLFCTFQIFIYQ